MNGERTATEANGVAVIARLTRKSNRGERSSATSMVVAITNTLTMISTNIRAVSTNPDGFRFSATAAAISIATPLASTAATSRRRFRVWTTLNQDRFL